MLTRLVLVPVVLLIAALVVPAHAGAVTFTVTTAADVPGVVDGACDDSGGGTCSLREAVREANATAAADVVQLTSLGAPAQVLSGGAEAGDAATNDLDITRHLTIIGAGASCADPATDTLDISAAGTGRIFEVHPNIDLTLECVALGDVATAGADGGSCIQANGAGVLFVLRGSALLDCNLPRSAPADQGSAIDTSGARYVAIDDSRVQRTRGATRSSPGIRSRGELYTHDATVLSDSVGPMIRASGERLALLGGTITRSGVAVQSTARYSVLWNMTISANGGAGPLLASGTRGNGAVQIVAHPLGEIDLSSGMQFIGNPDGALVIDAADTVNVPITLGGFFAGNGTELDDSSPVADDMVVSYTTGRPALQLLGSTSAGGGGGLLVEQDPAGGQGYIQVNGLAINRREPATRARCGFVVCISAPASVVNVTSTSISGLSGPSGDTGFPDEFRVSGRTLDVEGLRAHDVIARLRGETDVLANQVLLDGTHARLVIDSGPGAAVLLERAQILIENTIDEYPPGLPAVTMCGQVHRATILNLDAPAVSTDGSGSCNVSLERTLLSVSGSPAACALAAPGDSITSVGDNVTTVDGAACGFDPALDDTASGQIALARSTEAGWPLLRPVGGDGMDIVAPGATGCDAGAAPGSWELPVGPGCDAGVYEGAAAARADLRVTSAGGAPLLDAGERSTTTFTVTNAGPDLARAARLDITVPATLTVTAWPAGCAPTPTGGACLFGTLRVGATRTVVLEVAAGAVSGLQPLVASVTSSTANADVVADDAPVMVYVRPPATTAPTPPGPAVPVVEPIANPPAPGVLDPRIALPTATREPVVVGDAVVGGRVACTTGVWRDAESYEYAWLVGGAPIVGANDQALALVAAMRGQSLTCRVTARNAGGSFVAITEPFGPVRARGEDPVSTVRPACTLRGTNRSETLVGTPRRDVICGFGGDDTIRGLGGNDVLLGGPGRDRIDGGPGNDLLDGGAGRDTVRGSAGHDTLRGGADADAVRGEAGNDSLLGGAGADTLDGGAGGDVANGGDGADTLLGGAGFDLLSGGRGNDVVKGGAAYDLLMGNPGDDRLEGGAGDDLIWGGPGNDGLDGGADRDQLYGMDGDDVFVPDPLDYVSPGPGTDRLGDTEI